MDQADELHAKGGRGRTARRWRWRWRWRLSRDRGRLQRWWRRRWRKLHARHIRRIGSGVDGDGDHWSRRNVWSWRHCRCGRLCGRRRRQHHVRIVAHGLRRRRRGRRGYLCCRHRRRWRWRCGRRRRHGHDCGRHRRASNGSYKRHRRARRHRHRRGFDHWQCRLGRRGWRWNRRNPGCIFAWRIEPARRWRRWRGWLALGDPGERRGRRRWALWRLFCWWRWRCRHRWRIPHRWHGWIGRQLRARRPRRWRWRNDRHGLDCWCCRWSGWRRWWRWRRRRRRHEPRCRRRWRCGRRRLRNRLYVVTLCQARAACRGRGTSSQAATEGAGAHIRRVTNQDQGTPRSSSPPHSFSRGRQTPLGRHPGT